MSKSYKSMLLVTGIVILAYGIYTLFQPETQVSVGDLDLIKAQDNTGSYITIGIGIVTIVLSLFIRKK